MANTLSIYDPVFYAQEAIAILKKSLGMAGRVYRALEREPREFGQTIEIRKPSTFTAEDQPGSDQDITASKVSMKLDKWKGVKFALSDQELTWTGDRIIREHIAPAAYAVADAVDLALADLYKDVPWFVDTSSPVALGDISSVFQKLFDNKAPVSDGDLHFMVNGQVQKELQDLTVFHSAQVAGSAAEQTLMRGSLGQRLGFEFFANQNVKTHTKGTASTGSLLVNGATAKGATSINLDAGSVTGTLVPGDSFSIAGDSQRYAVTNTVTASGNAFAGVTFTPELAVAAADNAAVTVELADKTRSIAFHRNAFALVMAPLSELGNGRGAEIATVIDEDTGLALRSRVWYDGNNSKLKVGIDALFAVKTIEPNLACLLRD